MNLNLFFRNKTFLKIFSVFSAYFVLLPFIILVVVPLYIYKRIVIYLSKGRKNYAPLSVDDCIHIVDDIHGRPSGSISGVVCLKSGHSFDDLVARVERVIAKVCKVFMYTHC